LQQAISACVIEEFGKQAKAGIAAQRQISENTSMERHFAM